MSIFEFIIRQITGRSNSTPTRRQLINREAEIGGKLFGPVPEGHQRHFFCLDAHTWVWHEGWRDPSGRNVLITTRYEINGDQILKVQDGQPYQQISLPEARRLLTAVREYSRRIKSEIYARKLAV